MEDIKRWLIVAAALLGALAGLSPDVAAVLALVCGWVIASDFDEV